jgi:hypothetical protein
VQVIKPETSEKMRYLFRLNATDGNRRRAEVAGYRVGGKTGTAQKVVKGRYSNDKRLNAFIGAFPMDQPRYLLMVLLDEPKPVAGTHGICNFGVECRTHCRQDGGPHRTAAGGRAQVHAGGAGQECRYPDDGLE